VPIFYENHANMHYILAAYHYLHAMDQWDVRQGGNKIYCRQLEEKTKLELNKPEGTGETSRKPSSSTRHLHHIMLHALVLNGLTDMGGGYVFLSFQIGNGARAILIIRW